MSDFCSNCGDYNEEGVCWYCHNAAKKTAAEREAIDDVGTINTTFDRPIRIVVRPIRNPESEWKWSIAVNIGGWKRGKIQNVSSNEVVRGIAYAMQLLVDENQ